MDASHEENDAGEATDFPEFVGAMIVKELRQGMRARRFVVPFVFVHFLMVYALFSDLASIRTGYGGRAFWFFQDLNLDLHGQSSYWFMTSFMLLVVVPLGGVGSLQKETTGANVELLLLTRLSRWQVVGGQWLVLCLQGGLIYLTTIPYLIVRYSLVGGINVVATLVAVLFLLCLHAMANALAVGLSGYAKPLFRILIGGFSVGAVFFTSMIIIGCTIYNFEMLFSIRNSELPMATAFLVGLLATTVYFTLLFLQLGRARIRLFEKPYEPPQSRGVVTLIIVSPLIMGFTALGTMTWGVLPVTLLIIWSTWKIDKSPLMNPGLHPS